MMILCFVGYPRLYLKNVNVLHVAGCNNKFNIMISVI